MVKELQLLFSERDGLNPDYNDKALFLECYHIVIHAFSFQFLTRINVLNRTYGTNLKAYFKTS